MSMWTLAIDGIFAEISTWDKLMWRWCFNVSLRAKGNDNFLSNGSNCALDHFSLVLPDNAAQIIAVQCHEEELTFPRRETEHRCQ